MNGLPGPRNAVMKRLFAALDGERSERDWRIAILALSYLEPEARQCFYLTPAEKVQGLALLRDTARKTVAAMRLWWRSYDALHAVLWSMGVITTPPFPTKEYPNGKSAKNVRLLSDSVSREVTFPCLRCGGAVSARLGRKSVLNCPGCGNLIEIRINDGIRVAFRRQKKSRNPLPRVPQTPREEALQLLNASPNTPLAVVKTTYRTLLKQYHPDVILKLGDPHSLRAAEEITKALNRAWALIETGR